MTEAFVLDGRVVVVAFALLALALWPQHAPRPRRPARRRPNRGGRHV